MGIGEHLKTFAGMPVRDYEPGRRSRSRKPCVWRLRLDYEDEHTFPELLDLFLQEHGGPKTTALVIGAWADEDMVEAEGATEVVQALVSARDRLRNLKALFFGDVTQEECEISWISPGDVSALFSAYPKLEEFRVRGVGGLTFGKLTHPRLKSFAVESGGLPPNVLAEVFAFDLPRLEHLELWLGDSRYGGISDPAPLAPLLSGKLFPKLRSLGLRNSQIANAVAGAVADAPLLDRLKVLDLSLGNLTDVGAEALLGSTKVRKMKKLDLHHHFLSPVFVREVQTLPPEVDVSDPKEPCFAIWGETTEVYRFIVASE